MLFRSGKSRSTSVGSYVAVQSGDTLADFRFAGDDGSNLATYPVQIQAIVTGAVSAGAIPSALTFGTAASGNATERMRIDSAGFVGIGTVPYNILDIYKPQNASSIIRINNDNAGSSASAGITVQSDAGQINILQGSVANVGG